MIEIEHLNKTYPSPGGDIHALRDVNLRIEDGEIFGIIGLSGAGKSTLVRCINLLERPTSGTVRIDGRDMTQLSRRDLLKARQDIGMIFQSFNLLEQRTVLRNICFPLEIAGVKRDEAQARAAELLELVGLSDRAKNYPSQLSGGQKQRVAIARALATRPKYLLCDEATSALDPNTTQSILHLLKEINQTLGVTIVVITHEMRVRSASAWPSSTRAASPRSATSATCSRTRSPTSPRRSFSRRARPKTSRRARAGACASSSTAAAPTNRSSRASRSSATCR